MLGVKLIRAAASRTASAAALKRFLKGNSAGVFTQCVSLALGMLFRVSIADTVTPAAKGSFSCGSRSRRARKRQLRLTLWMSLLRSPLAA